MTLLAKSRSHGELTLEQHLRDTEQAAVRLFHPSTRWGARWPQFFKLDPADPRFLRELRVASLFHDIGKANEDFQRAVTSTAFHKQTLRHEHLSALVMCLRPFREWLSAGGVDADVCTAAVLSHHLKARDDDDAAHPDRRWGQFVGAPTLTVRFDDPQVQSILVRLSELLGRPAPALGSGVLKATLEGDWADAWRLGREAARKLSRALSRDERRKRLVAVKVGLIVSDAVASGLFRVGESIDDWVAQVAHASPLSHEAIGRDIIGNRLRHIGRGASVALHPFQKKAAEIGPRGLLLAACGAGKTLAAWAWAEAQAKTKPIGRVVFLYPTRGTSTEGFRDYAAWAPDGEAALVHGTAGYELQQMQDNPPESLRDRDVPESESRLYALGLWQRRYFSATVDQFLSAMEHRYEALCLLPALADAAVIFDEVHSFDPRMFKSLIAFLREFDVPVLCMTATLPSERSAQLKEAGLRVFPSAAETAELADLSAKERAPRYRVHRVPDAELALAKAEAAFRDGRRVLWVVNQVARAQALASALQQRLGEEVLCYHSRFRLVDRQRTHQRTVESFQQTERPVIAVTTQVCEMSLDLDADVLLTEEAPVTSMVQRFGRSNRHLRRPGVLADVFTYPADGTSRPYSRSDMAGVQEFLTGLDGREVCQAELSQAIEALDLGESDATGASSLFDSGYYAVPHDFRDLDEFARPCILSTDVERFLELKNAGSPTDGLIVPVPRKWAGATAIGMPPFLSIADATNYSETRGFVAPQREVS
jgi:CRISPR-associated endonuclease/helicase Cas3